MINKNKIILFVLVINNLIASVDVLDFPALSKDRQTVIFSAHESANFIQETRKALVSLKNAEFYQKLINFSFKTDSDWLTLKNQNSRVRNFFKLTFEYLLATLKTMKGIVVRFLFLKKEAIHIHIEIDFLFKEIKKRQAAFSEKYIEAVQDFIEKQIKLVKGFKKNKEQQDFILIDISKALDYLVSEGEISPEFAAAKIRSIIEALNSSVSKLPKGAISQKPAPSQGQQDQSEDQGQPGQPDQPSQQYQVPGQQPWVLIAQPNSGPAATEQLDSEEEQERLRSEAEEQARLRSEAEEQARLEQARLEQARLEQARLEQARLEGEEDR